MKKQQKILEAAADKRTSRPFRAMVRWIFAVFSEREDALFALDFWELLIKQKFQLTK
jgi:hypothetical protein